MDQEPQVITENRKRPTKKCAVKKQETDTTIKAMTFNRDQKQHCTKSLSVEPNLMHGGWGLMNKINFKMKSH